VASRRGRSILEILRIPVHAIRIYNINGECTMNMLERRRAAFRRRLTCLLPILSLAAGLHANAQTLRHRRSCRSWFKIRNSFAAQYEARQTEDAALKGQYGVSVRSMGTPTKGAFSGIIQASHVANALRGQRVAMRAWIRTESAESQICGCESTPPTASLRWTNMERRAVSAPPAGCCTRS